MLPTLGSCQQHQAQRHSKELAAIWKRQWPAAPAGVGQAAGGCAASRWHWPCWPEAACSWPWGLPGMARGCSSLQHPAGLDCNLLAAAQQCNVRQQCWGSGRQVQYAVAWPGGQKGLQCPHIPCLCTPGLKMSAGFYRLFLAQFQECGAGRGIGWRACSPLRSVNAELSEEQAQQPLPPQHCACGAGRGTGSLSPTSRNLPALAV